MQMKELNRDVNWLRTKDFVQKYMQFGERIIAPHKFKHNWSNFYSYRFTYESIAGLFQWVLIHKGKLHNVDNRFLKQTLKFLKPVFANEVFVVFSSRSDIPQADIDSVHLQPLLQVISPQTALQPRSTPSLKQRLLSPFKNLKQWFADPRLENITSQLDVALDRLSGLEKDTHKLRQEVQGKSSWVRSSLVLAGMSLEELRSTCRLSCQTAYLGDDTILCRVLGNYLLYGDTKDIGIVPHLCLNGFWEPWVTLAMLRVLRPGWHCLDVGANHGYYSLVMASLVGTSGQIVALEPNTKLAHLVSKTLEVNGFADRATAVAKAVSDRSGEMVQLVIPTGHTGHASLHYVPTATDQVMQVETITIDQMTADWTRTDLIKIDVEGAEYAVWRGMQQTIQRHPNIVIILEFGAARYADPRAFLEEITAAGFILRYIDYDSHPKKLSIDRCLSERLTSHWDLFLSRY